MLGSNGQECGLGRDISVSRHTNVPTAVSYLDVVVGLSTDDLKDFQDFQNLEVRSN